MARMVRPGSFRVYLIVVDGQAGVELYPTSCSYSFPPTNCSVRLLLQGKVSIPSIVQIEQTRWLSMGVLLDVAAFTA